MAKPQKATAKPEPISDEERAKLRDELLQQLADLGPAPAPAGMVKLKPGTIYGSGVNQDKVDFRTEDFMQEELKEVLETEENLPITVNGVTFMVYKGYNCKLPMSHYLVYQNYKRNKLRVAQQWAPPPYTSNQPGYMPPVHEQATGPLPSRESEGRTALPGVKV